MIAICGSLLTAALYFAIHPKSKIEYIANKFLGEKWYQVHMGTTQIGYMKNTVERNPKANWLFTTTTHFYLTDNKPVTTVKVLEFANAAPHKLIYAYYHTMRQPIDSQVEARLIDDSYSVLVRRGIEDTTNILQWDFNLSDFLAVELWLNEQPRSESDRKTTRSLDLEKLRIVNRSYNIVNINRQGYLLENASPLQPTRTQLDQNLQPVELSMAGIFHISASDRKGAIALEKIGNKTNLLIPINERLVNPKEIKHLVLNVKLSATHKEQTSRDFPGELRSTVNSYQGSEDPSEELGETIRYPIYSTKIDRLKGLPERFASPDDLKKLVGYVHALLQYRENRPVGSVIKSLELGYGECTDFTDLFTTLARSRGLPTKPIYGIAYKDGSRPGFMFHSWNKVYFDGEWVSIDATWNQSPSDATHITLSEIQYSTLLTASTTKSVSLTIDEVSYDH